MENGKMILYCHICRENKKEDEFLWAVKIFGKSANCQSTNMHDVEYKEALKLKNQGLLYKDPLQNAACKECRPKWVKRHWHEKGKDYLLHKQNEKEKTGGVNKT